ncbi:MAG: hypothetical protein ACTSYT_01480 [Candidatus Asgardarchaeia archaeon]
MVELKSMGKNIRSLIPITLMLSFTILSFLGFDVLFLDALMFAISVYKYDLPEMFFGEDVDKILKEGDRKVGNFMVATICGLTVIFGDALLDFVSLLITYLQNDSFSLAFEYLLYAIILLCCCTR